MSHVAAAAFWFGVIALAVYRVTEMVVLDAGPFDVFFRVRTWTLMYDRDGDGKPYFGANRVQKFVGGMLECVYCTGVWVALAGALMWAILAELEVSPRGVIGVLVIWFALAGLQSVLENVAGRVKAT